MLKISPINGFIMNNFLVPSQYDLATPDGTITQLNRLNERSAQAVVFIQNISPQFVGFEIDKSSIFFNIKSTLAQLGINGTGLTYECDKKTLSAQVLVQLDAYGPIAIEDGCGTPTISLECLDDLIDGEGLYCL